MPPTISVLVVSVESTQKGAIVVSPAQVLPVYVGTGMGGREATILAAKIQFLLGPLERNGDKNRQN